MQVNIGSKQAEEIGILSRQVGPKLAEEAGWSWRPKNRQAADKGEEPLMTNFSSKRFNPIDRGTAQENQLVSAGSKGLNAAIAQQGINTN